MANKYLDYDGLVEVASKLKETIDGKQDALIHYSETSTVATLGANVVNIDAGEGGINLTHGSKSLSLNTVNNKNAAYYNGSEIATVDDLSDYLTSTEAEETYQEKLNYYQERGNGDRTDIRIGEDGGEVNLLELYGNSLEFVAEEEAFLQAGNNVVQADESGAFMASGHDKLVVAEGKATFDNNKILDESDVVDSLESTSTTAPLSANQGKVLDEGKQDKLEYYTEGSLPYPSAQVDCGAYSRNAGAGLTLYTNPTSSSSNYVQIDLVDDTGEDNYLRLDKDGVHHNGKSLEDVNHLWMCPSKLSPNTVSNLYPQIGSPSVGDFILWITLNSSNVNINPLQITSVTTSGDITYTDLRSTWASL